MSTVLELIQSPLEMRCASKDERAASVQRSPRQNRILATLPLDDYERLLPELEPVPLHPGECVHRGGDAEKHLYFLTSGIVSQFYITESGASTGFAVTGREGMIGVGSILSDERTRTHAMVLSAGHAFRMSMDVAKDRFNLRHPLRHLLFRYLLALITQVAQTAACNRHHSVEQRLCRWLLMCLDRLRGKEVPMTHEMIASLLGVRREGVTAAAGKMQEEGLIQCGRGKVTLLDRLKLEARVCECYVVVEREYDRLLPQITATRAFDQGTAQPFQFRPEEKESVGRTSAWKSRAQRDACYPG